MTDATRTLEDSLEEQQMKYTQEKDREVQELRHKLLERERKLELMQFEGEEQKRLDDLTKKD